MDFSSGLIEKCLFWIYFTLTLLNTTNGVIEKNFWSHMITIKKVTRLRVKISKSTIKSIFRAFPLV